MSPPPNRKYYDTFSSTFIPGCCASANARASSVVQPLPIWARKTSRASATEIPAYLLARETCRSIPWQELVYGLCYPLRPWEWVRTVLNPPDSLFWAHFTVSSGSSCSHFTAHISLSCQSSSSFYSPSSHPSLPFNDNLSHFLSLI